MKIKGVWMSLSLVLVLSLALATPIASADNAVRAKRLTGQIDYWISADFGLTDDVGRTLVWEGTIQGDINGTMKWWFVIPPPFAGQIDYIGGRVNYYAARWEIWDADGQKLLLAGNSAGKTVTPWNEDGMWDGHGVVTEARKAFNPLKGRHIYETGPVQFDAGPPYGTGVFVIY